MTSYNPNELIGIEAAAAYRRILLRHANVSGITLFRYQSPVHLQERIALNDEGKRLVDRANINREGTGVPFWEALFAMCIAEQSCDDSILAEAFFRNGQGASRFVSRREIDSGVIESTLSDARQTVALGSQLADANGVLGHLGFLDLHCSVSAYNQGLVHKVCRHVMPSGFLILDSGASYHACTVNVISSKERIQMLGKALLVSPVVDARYIAHQLQQDSSSIRISRGGSARKVPIVVDAWSP